MEPAQQSPEPITPAPGTWLLMNCNVAQLAVRQAISHLGDGVYSPTLLVWVYVLIGSVD